MRALLAALALAGCSLAGDFDRPLPEGLQGADAGGDAAPEPGCRLAADCDAPGAICNARGECEVCDPVVCDDDPLAHLFAEGDAAPRADELCLVQVGCDDRCAYPTIEAALAHPEGHDGVQLCAGTYAPVEIDEPLAIFGPERGEPAIIDAQGAPSAITVRGTVPISSQGALIVRLGWVDLTGASEGALVVDRALVVGEAVSVYGNTREAQGAGFDLQSAALTLVRSDIFANEATRPDGSPQPAGAAGLLRDSSFAGSETAIEDNGTGIAASASFVSLDRGTINDNVLELDQPEAEVALALDLRFSVGTALGTDFSGHEIVGDGALEWAVVSVVDSAFFGGRATFTENVALPAEGLPASVAENYRGSTIFGRETTQDENARFIRCDECTFEDNETAPGPARAVAITADIIAPGYALILQRTPFPASNVPAAVAYDGALVDMPEPSRGGLDRLPPTYCYAGRCQNEPCLMNCPVGSPCTLAAQCATRNCAQNTCWPNESR